MGKGQSTGTVLFVIALVALTTAASAIWIYSPAVAQSGQESWAVKDGDNLTYEVSGHRDGAPVTGMAYANFTEVNITENGRSVAGYFSTYLGDWTVEGVSRALSDPSLGNCVGQQAISTQFGEKYVTRCISFSPDTGGNESSFIVVYAGVESRIIYQINVSGPSFFLTFGLVSSTVEGTENLDLKAKAHLTLDVHRPEERWTMNYEGGGASSFGVWDLPEGTLFSYSLEGNGSTFLLFDEGNIHDMEHGGTLEFDPDISILDPPGSRSKVLNGGLCMVVTFINGDSDGAEEEFILTYPS